MGFLAALVSNILEKVLTWILSKIGKKIKDEKQIKDDNAKAVENEKKVAESQTDEERHKSVEDLLNGN